MNHPGSGTRLFSEMRVGVRFTVLGSGSSGNASLLQCGGRGLLIDAGFGPRTIAGRLRAAGAAWDDVDAVILTHTHSDHWCETTLAQLVRREIPFYCHRSHARRLRDWSGAFAALESAGLVRTYEPGRSNLLCGELRVRPFPISHDGGATFGFRIEGGGDLFERRWAVAYAADLGTWDQEIASLLCDADLLALEFNHDVALQRSSGRPRRLIERVLGDEGHLSNEQAADLLRAIVQAGRPGRLQHLVQLHLSRQCNRPQLAAAAAQAICEELAAGWRQHVASQDSPLQILPSA
jgi:phosphoribosyl 1,2-cyclic phosphodiesterase